MEQTEKERMHHVAVVASAFTNSSTEQTVAFLHDAVEDGLLTIEQIGLMFGVIVRDAVDILSRRDSESYDDYIDRVRAAFVSGTTSGVIARAVKLVDLRVNLVRAPERLKARYRKAITSLTCADGRCGS